VVDNKIKDKENDICTARTLKENFKQIAITAAEKKSDSQIHTYINRAGKRTTFCNAPPKTNNNTTKVDDIILKDSVYIDSIKGKNLGTNSYYEMSYENAKLYVLLCI